MERMNASEKIFKIISYILIGMVALFTLYPLIYTFSASLSSKDAYETGQVVLWPVQINFDVYKMIYNKNAFWVSYINTLFYTVYGTIWSMIVSMTGAYALSKAKLIFRKNFNFLIAFTMMFSAGMLPTYLNYRQLHVANRWGMIFAFGVQAYNIILLRNYFESIPSEIEEAARIDGANEFQIFTKIYIPMSGASIATVALFYATSRWNGFFWSMILLSDANEKPLQVFLRTELATIRSLIDNMGIVDFSPDSYAYAILVCSIIPILIVYPYIQKYFAKGVNLGGVKG